MRNRILKSGYCAEEITSDQDAWVKLAKWNLGEISNSEYADYIEARSTGDQTPAERILIDELRKEAMTTESRSPRIEEVTEGTRLHAKESLEELYVDWVDPEENTIWVREKLRDGTWSMPFDIDPDDTVL